MLVVIGAGFGLGGAIGVAEGDQGIELPGGITPGNIDPSDLNCCLGPGSACQGEGVTDLPCCATPDLEKPDGCAWSATPPIALVCPGF